MAKIYCFFYKQTASVIFFVKAIYFTVIRYYRTSKYIEVLKKAVSLFIFIFIITTSVFSQRRKIQNQPYADLKLYHLGLHVGFHTQDLILTNSGNVTSDGRTLYAEIPGYSPGFSVGGIADLFLNPYMNLRLTPTIHFGNKTIYFKDLETQEEETASVRSNYLSIPLSLKVSSMRLNNYRPYIVTGVYGAVDLGRKKGYPILLKSFDYGFEFGFGCNIYMPYFKLAPEIKFRFGIPDILEKNREDLTNQADKIYTNALSKATTRMIIFTFNFE